MYWSRQVVIDFTELQQDPPSYREAIESHRLYNVPPVTQGEVAVQVYTGVYRQYRAYIKYY